MVERNPLHFCLKSVWIDNSLRENHPYYDHMLQKTKTDSISLTLSDIILLTTNVY